MVAIYCDGAVLADMERFADDDRVSGFTSNPSLLRKSGITHYADFARTVLSLIRGKPISFEVVADDWPTMEHQARIIQGWGENVWVKLPCQNTLGESCLPSMERLKDCRLNITAIFTPAQYESIKSELKHDDIASIFAGRIMDTGLLPKFTNTEYRTGNLLWASTREVYNFVQAQLFGYDIITMTPSLIDKLSMLGKNLDEYSRETVTQFYEDGKGLVVE